MTKKPRPLGHADVANRFVRHLIASAGRSMLVDAEERLPLEAEATLAFFGNRCAYSGEPFGDGPDARQWDHAVPLNQTHAGLHLPGNLVPVRARVNQAKRGDDYRKFLEDAYPQAVAAERIAKIDEFRRLHGYDQHEQAVGKDLQKLCQQYYELVSALCKTATLGLEVATSVAGERARQSDTAAVLVPTNDARLAPEIPEAVGTPERPVLELQTEEESEFEERLLEVRKARVTAFRLDGSEVFSKPWVLKSYTTESDLRNNLWTRDDLRRAARLEAGIVRVRVEVAE